MGTTVIRSLGIDPGSTTGIALLTWHEKDWSPADPALIRSELRVYQCNSNAAIQLIESLQLLHRMPVQVERFVVGPRAARSCSPASGADTRALIEQILAIPELHVEQRSAAEVKPWATDARLDAAGLLTPTKGMPHARDACRHALFCAVRNYGMPDPLSRKAGAR